MGGHYTLSNPNQHKVDSIKQRYLKQGYLDKQSIEMLDANNAFNYLLDAKSINSSFLIKNIDEAFETWGKRPWSKHISFHSFCEYILPYRIDNEALEDWRELYHNRYSFLLDSVYTGTDVISAANIVAQYLKNEGFYHPTYLNTPSASPSFLYANRIGKCNDECNLTVYVMRALGIPIQKDMYLFSPETQNAHGWCVILDTTGVNIPIYFTEYLAERGNMKTDGRKMCKIYRQSYIKNEPFSDFNQSILPTELKLHNFKDVTSEYFLKDLTIPVQLKDGQTAFLGTFNKDQVFPISVSRAKNGEVLFENVNNECIYVLFKYEKGKYNIISNPFAYINNKLHYFRPNTSLFVKEKVYRKYPLFKWNKERMDRILNAQFLGYNNVCHRKTLLYSVVDTPKIAYNIYPFTSQEKFQFIEYKVDKNEYLELGEMHFYSNGKEVIPSNIESCGAYYEGDDDMKFENCFDNNPLTYFLSKKKGVSILFDFETPIRIDEVLCIPRNDDNFIRIGDKYNVYYFSDTGWLLLKTIIPKFPFLEVEIPANSLIYVKNLTRGNEEQVFFMRDGKQVFVNEI